MTESEQQLVLLDIRAQDENEALHWLALALKETETIGDFKLLLPPPEPEPPEEPQELKLLLQQEAAPHCKRKAKHQVCRFCKKYSTCLAESP